MLAQSGSERGLGTCIGTAVATRWQSQSCGCSKQTFDSLDYRKEAKHINANIKVNIIMLVFKNHTSIALCYYSLQFFNTTYMNK